VAWIEVHQSLPNHKKTLMASDVLDIPPVHLMGHLTCFWLWALDNAPDGDLKGISAKVIARAAQWDGDSQQFLNALLQAGFIDQVGDSYVIHDWYDYAGRLIEKKRQEAERKQDIRRAYENGTIQEVKRRDGNYCRYCGREVDWTDRKTDKGATYDHVDPHKPATVDNLVITCRACFTRKGNRTPEEAGMILLPSLKNDLMQDLTRNKCGFNPHQTNLTLPNLTRINNNNLITCASADDDARAGNGQSPTVNNPVDDVEAEKVTVQPDEQLTDGRAAGQDPGGSVEAEKVTATPGEQRAKTPSEEDDTEEKPNKPRPPFKSKKQEQLFDQFWQLYPRKKNKGYAEKVWGKLRPNDELFTSILAGLERAKASYDWQKEGGKYIPYPATWLNAKGWEDDCIPAGRLPPLRAQLTNPMKLSSEQLARYSTPPRKVSGNGRDSPER